MKDTCLELAPVLTRLAEDSDPAAIEPRVAAHLAACGACQRSFSLQRDMHGLLRARAESLQERAPEAFRARLASQVETRVPRRNWARMPVAATVLLAVLGAMTYGMTSASSTVLAAQLSLDHIKCIRLVSHGTALNPIQALKEWAQRYEWTPRVPAPPTARRASLVGVRRCLYGHGHLAHLIYEMDGHAVSVFVMPRSEYPAAAAPAHHEVFGQSADLWSNGEQSFAIVGDVPPQMLAAIVEDFRKASE